MLSLFPTRSNPFPTWLRRMHPSLSVAEENHIYIHMQKWRRKTQWWKIPVILCGVVAPFILWKLDVGLASFLAWLVIPFIVVFRPAHRHPCAGAVDLLEGKSARYAVHVDLWMAGVTGRDLVQAAYLEAFAGSVLRYTWILLPFVAVLIFMFSAMPGGVFGVPPVIFIPLAFLWMVGIYVQVIFNIPSDVLRLIIQPFFLRCCNWTLVNQVKSMNRKDIREYHAARAKQSLQMIVGVGILIAGALLSYVFIPRQMLAYFALAVVTILNANTLYQIWTKRTAFHGLPEQYFDNAAPMYDYFVRSTIIKDADARPSWVKEEQEDAKETPTSDVVE